MPSLSARPPDTPPVLAVLDWVVQDGLDQRTRRRARIVATVGLISVFAILLLTLPLALTGTWSQIGQAVLAGLICAAALVLLRRGYVESAAWITTLMLTVTPIAQSAMDVGVRDPVLAFVIMAPLAAAMMSGVRLAFVSAALAAAGAAGLLALHHAGLAPPPVTSPEAVAWFSFLVPTVGALFAAGAGALYVRHSRSVIDEAETQAAELDSALRESEARYRSLFDWLPLGMYRTTPAGQILLANPSMARMVGVESPEAALGINAASLYTDPTRRAELQEALHRHGSIRRFEAEWRTPSGQVRQVRIDARAGLGADGAPLFYEGAVEDITSEQRAREALARSEARFRALVQRSSDLVVVLDREARLTYVSPAVVGLLGYAPDALLGRDALSLVHPDDRAAMHDRLFAGAVEGEGLEIAPTELRLRHTDGHFVYAEGVGSALYHDPAVGGLVLNIRDVTERKRAQAVLVQAKRQAEEVAHLKSTFLANMSHEIRTPLTAILGFSDILADEISDPQQQEFVELISRSGRRLMDTLNSVLDLARLEAGRGELACRPVRVADAAEEAASLMGPAAVERGLTLTAVVEAPAAAAALDEAAFARVLHNLVGNALKFTETGGVTIRVSEGAGDAAGRVVVRVEDTGIGIEDGFLPRLFGEFEQESAGIERTHEGAGLGLAISHQLVERMSGTIAVESQKGVGTTFTVTFPLLGTDTVEPVDEARLHVLVVDDNEQARLVAERVLDARYGVATAASGPEALALARSTRPDAVLLDIHLGDTVSGEDVLRDLRADPALAGLPVVAVTAYGLPGDRARFLALGFDDYITKPYTRERLLQAVGDSLARRGATVGV